MKNIISFTLPFVLMSSLFAEEKTHSEFDEQDPEVVEAIFQLRKEHAKNTRRADMLWRHSMADLIKKADHIAVYQLEDKLIDESTIKSEEIKDYLGIAPYGLLAQKKKQKILTKEESTVFINALHAVLKDPQDNLGAFDHKPEYGVTIYWKKTAIFQTSFSFTSSSYFALYGIENQSCWVDFTSEPLHKLFRSYFP